jgi:ribosome-binding protein aMBF1 (putative translation factor)
MPSLSTILLSIKEIEAKRLLPTEEQKRRIQRYLGVQLKIDTVSA